MCKIAVALPLALLLAAEDKPAPKFPLGKETTYVTGPLDKDGYVDYEAALNDRLGKGITPERNVNVLIWKALGPRPQGGGAPPEFFKRLGVEEPPAGGDYFVGLTAYLKDHLKLPQAEWSAVYEQQGRAARRPWAAKDYPHIADWLKANEKPLAVVVEATRRPDYFRPVVATRRPGKLPGPLIGALTHGVQECREFAAAFCARATLRVAEGKPDDAWQDLLACHRLARLVGRGATLIEGLVDIALEQVAANATLAYLERADLTSAQALDRLKDLRNLPPVAPMADKLDLGERFTYLDVVQQMRRGRLNDGPSDEPATPEELKALEKIDWVPVLRTGNRMHDRLAAALRLPTRAERGKERARIGEELEVLVKEATKEPGRLEALFGDPGKAAGRRIGAILTSLHAYSIGRVSDTYDRVEQVGRNLSVAFALAAYRADRGRYPAGLDELAPKYLAAVPDDLFSDRPLVYRPADGGYLLYSVGVNGKDEDGRWTDDDPPGDDLPVRMPPRQRPK